MNRSNIFLIAGILFLHVQVFAQTTIVEGPVSGIWNKPDSPYLVNGDIYIHSDSVLTIESGVDVQFTSQFKLTVEGLLKAHGQQDDSIIFEAPGSYYGWRGIQIVGPHADSSILDYCIIKNFRYGGSYPETKNGAVSVFNRDSVRISNCHIHSNILNDYHSALRCENSDILIEKNLIEYNYGGGIYCWMSSPIIRDNDIRYNDLKGYSAGGGISCNRKSNAFISNNRIIGNTSSYGGGGGIGCVDSSDAVIISNVISYNQTNAGGGILVAGYSNVNVINNLISKNIANKSARSSYGGGAVKVSRSELTLVNNTIAGNEDYGVFALSSTINCINTVFSDNLYYGKMVHFNVDDEYEDTTKINFTNCILEGGTESIEPYFSRELVIGDTMNLYYGPPGFLDTDFNDYSADIGSALINRGTIDTTGFGIPHLDLSGYERVFKDTIDIGAYEFRNVVANRVPRLGAKMNYILNPGEILPFEVDYFDPDTADTHTFTVVADNPNVEIGGKVIEEGRIMFTLIPLTPIEDTVELEIILDDGSGEVNATDRLTFRVVYVRTLMMDQYTISENLTWSCDTVQIFTNVRVVPGALLEIHPGTYVEFQGGYSLDIDGRLVALGTSTDSIRFTHKSQTAGSWNRIEIENSSNDTSYLDHCIIEFAAFGVLIRGNTNMLLSNSAVRYNKQGVFCGNKSIIQFCDIYGNHSTHEGAGIFGDGLLYGNRIHHNTTTQNGGGVCVNSNMRLISNVIYDNRAVKGGGIYADGPTFAKTYLLNNTIVKNHAGSAGGMNVPTHDFILANNIFQYNTADDNTDQLAIGYHGQGLRFHHNYIQGGLDHAIKEGYTFEGIEIQTFIEGSDFSDTLNHDFSLIPSSVCINAGTMDTSILFAPHVFDIDRLQVLDGVIDLGACEFSGVTENRLPLLEKKNELYIRPDTVTQIKISYTELDLNDPISLELELSSSEVQIKTSQVLEDDVIFELEPAEGFQGAVTLYLALIDQSDSIGYPNADTITLFVSNTHHLCGRLNSNTIWEADTIIVECNTIVNHDVVLTINTGTVIDFRNQSSLEIRGLLRAQGEAGDTIVFTSSEGSWNGLSIELFEDFSTLTSDTCILSGCVIENSARAGLSIRRDKVLLEESRISNNLGSGILIDYDKSPVIINNLITGNSGYYAGGIDSNMGSPLIKGNIIQLNNFTVTNWAGQNGGGIRCVKGSPVIQENIIRWNEGGGVFVGMSNRDVSPRIINNMIYENRDYQSKGGSGIRCNYCEEPTIIHGNLVFGNTSSADGGGIELVHSRVTLCNNTILDNTSTEEGGGLYIGDDCWVKVYNSLLFNNTHNDNPSDVYLGWRHQSVEIFNTGTTLGNGSIVEWDGTPDNLITESIFNQDPFFRNPMEQDFRLSARSPYVDAGIADTTGLLLPVTDFSGVPRILGDRIDIGAFENNDILVTGIKLWTDGDVRSIENSKDSLQMLVDFTPLDATYRAVEWTLAPTLEASISPGGMLKSSGTEAGNGSVWVVAETIDGTGIRDSLFITISNQIPQGTKEFVADRIQVYPNPSHSGRFYLCTGYSGTDVQIVSVYNMKGACILSANVGSDIEEIDLGANPGIYVVELKTHTGVAFRRKLIVN